MGVRPAWLRLPTVGLLLLACGCAGTSERSSGQLADASNFNRAVNAVVRPSSTPGGTLRVLVPAGCLDGSASPLNPACMNLDRLTTRQLMAFGDASGQFGSVAVPDLAAGPGMPSQDGRIWTYRLRTDVNWQDGSPITATQVAQGIRRLPTTLATVTEVEVVDVDLVRVHLREPVPAFDALVALPLTAPVHPQDESMASGPYRRDPEAITASGGAGVMLIRNQSWQAASDPVRRALVDRIALVPATSAGQVLAMLGDGRADVSVGVDFGTALAQMLTQGPVSVGDVDDPGTGAVVMLKVSRSTAGPLATPACRRAVFTALDRIGISAALSQSSTDATTAVPVLAYAPAFSLSAPTIASFDPSYVHWPVGGGHGDPDAAAADVHACGRPDGFTIRLAVHLDVSGAARSGAIQQLQSSLGRIGIEVVPVTGSDQADLVLLAFQADVPGVWGYWHPLAAEVDVSSVNLLLGSTKVASDDPRMQAELGRMVDRLILETGMFIPVAYARNLDLRPAQLTNVTTNGGLGNDYDLVNLGLAQ